MVDVGAHHGLWSLYSAHLVGSTGWVFAIEPSDAYDVLAANSAHYPQIVPLRIGLGREDAEMVFFGQGSGRTGSFVRAVTALNTRFYEEPIQGRLTPLARLDTLMDRHQFSPALVKIDVEGFEADVLHGASRLLQQRPTLIVEVHPPQLALSGSSTDAVLGYIADAGYDITVIDRHPHYPLFTLLARPKAGGLV
jgi:FkbM family methyltransferase